MTWQEIKTSADNTHFLYEDSPIFGHIFEEVLKFHAPGIAPVKDNTGSFHIDVNGQSLYQERYTRTFGYYNNRAAVIKGNEWFHLNEKGQRVYPLSYSWAGNFQENICPIKDSENRYFHIDLFGNRIYSASYSYCGDFKDGFACVKTENGAWRHIDSNGDFLNEKEFLDLNVFHKSIATAKDHTGWFHINKNGDQLYCQRYHSVEPFYNGLALVTKANNQKLIIDEKGCEILKI